MNDNATHLYRLCLKSKPNQPHSALELSHTTLNVIRCASIEDGEWISTGAEKQQTQMELFKISKDGGFVFAVMERILEWFEDEGLTVESLNAAAGLEDDGDVVVEAETTVEEAAAANDPSSDEVIFDSADANAGYDRQEGYSANKSMDQGDLKSPSLQIEEDNKMASTSDGRKLFSVSKEEPKTYNDNIDIDPNELHCFQLRTKILGLSIPSFTTELWKYLQLAGWTYVGGSYRPPKEKTSDWSDPQLLARQIFRQFSEGNDMSGQKEEEESDSEEGPEIFSSPNEIMDYLDQYCLPDYNLTPLQVQKERERLAKNTPAYERRCKRLRYELLEIAFRERTRQHAKKLARKDGVLETKYGHNHRPCEVCFKGSSPLYPRVACRDCGLVVHTDCYGLNDYNERKGGNDAESGSQNRPEVDSKGFFQCEVCKVGLCVGSISNKKLWRGPQSARWRAYSHPTAICQICDYQFIAGGMVQIMHETTMTDGNRSKKRRRSREKESCETWVHIYCYSALTGKGYNHMSQNAEEVIDQLGKLPSPVQNCRYCTKISKALTVECKRKCGNYFHPICLQFEQSKTGSWNGTTDICDQCSLKSVGDRRLEDSPKSCAAAIQPEPVKYTTAGSDQYFKQPKKKKTKKDSEKAIQSKEVIAIPPIRDSIAEARKVYDAEQCEAGFNAIESQYSNQFREWAFSLSSGQSILLYGLGSKRCVLESFGDALAAEGNVIAINGYDASANLSEFFDIMVQIVSPDDSIIPFDMSSDNTNFSETKRDWVKKASFVAEHYSDDRPLFILIHNIDGEKFSSARAQEALATLTSGSKKDGRRMIRIAASIDDVNRSMFWDPQTEHKFEWVWRLVHTYRPHFEELEKGSTQESSDKKKAKKKQYSRNMINVESVLNSLAPRHKEVVMLLADLKSKNSTVSYKELRKACAKEMILFNDSNLRPILKELRDHRIVQHGSQLGSDGFEEETVSFPTDDIVREILEFRVRG